MKIYHFMHKCMLQYSKDLILGSIHLLPCPGRLRSELINVSAIGILQQNLLDGFDVVVVVDCGLTSHSAIFQLYSDGGRI